MNTAGIRVLFLVGLVVWGMSIFFFPQNPLEHELYDFQTELLLLHEGDPRPPESLVMAAIDREAYQQGLRKSHIPEIVKSLEGQVVDINEQPLDPFLKVDSDGVLRSVQLFVRRGDRIVFCPPLRDYLKFRNISPEDVKATKRGLIVGQDIIATDTSGRFYPFFPVADQYELRAKQMGLKALTDSALDGLATQPSFEPVTVTVLAEKNISLKNRITLVGVFLKEAESIELDTPGGDMVKIQLYASVISNLLRGDYLRPVSPFLNLVASLAFLLILSTLLPGRRTIGALGVWLLWAAAWLGMNIWLFRYHYMLHQSAPLVASLAVLGVHILRRSWRVSLLLQGLGGRAPLQSSGVELEATILFTNLPDSIKEMESTDPEQALSARTAHSKCVGYSVNQYGGRLVDLQGDAQMIAFGLEGGPHQAQAVSCALDIVERVNLLLKGSEGEGHQVSCGVVTGLVATGQVGGGDYRGVAAIGDTTNSAARLMGQARKRNKSVLASAQTVEALGSRAVTNEMGELSVKGREEPLKVREVVSFQSPPIKPVEVHGKRGSLILRSGLLGGTLLSLFFSYWLSGQDFVRLTVLDLVTPTGQSAPIVVAGLDEESLDFGEWPWPRSLHARAIANCQKAGAACVFLDLLFEDPTDPQEDQQLVDTILNKKNVVVGAAAVAGRDGRPLPPLLLPGLLDSKRWGLINHAPANEDVIRHALWELPIKDGAEMERVPGVAKRVVQILEPDMSEQLKGRDDYLIRWGRKPTTVSYYRLLNPADPIFESLEGKIVIVGDNLSGNSDAFQTPMGLMKGAHIHAQSIQTLINDELLFDGSRSWLSALLSGLCAVTLIFLSWRTFGVLGQVTLLVGGTAGAMLLISLAVRAGIFLGAMPLVTSVVAVIVGWLLTVADTNRSLTNYIPRKLQRQLERDGTVADLTTVGTVLLTDIRGYTSLSEGRSPTDILDLLNSYHEKTAAVYSKYGGHLLTYQGDAQIVVFGPLEPVQDPVCSAMLSALELDPIVKDVGREAGLEDGVLRVGSGVTTGTITLSLMGAAGQLQYSVFGAPVREAHFLQSLSDDLDSPVILDHRSYLLLRDVERLQGHKIGPGEIVYTPVQRTLGSSGQ